MSNIPEHYSNLQSYLLTIPDFDDKLSETLDDIGVNNDMVQRRRRNELLHEHIGTVMAKVRGHNRPEYHFGSRSEGATTTGLQSDLDRLFCVSDINVIQNMEELRPEDYKNTMNLLMIQGDGIAPGYCHLEVINDRLRLSKIDVTEINDHYVRVKEDCILYKNTVMEDFMSGGGERHGPSWAKEGQVGFIDQDTVAAFHCKSWPYQARGWLNRRNNGWPTDELKNKCMADGCFVVPTGSCPGKYFEWRVSTSLAERQLMFSLNITQLRCYVLMKMIIKTFMKEEQKGKISSFMCKSVLMHCIESSLSNEWKEYNLSQCLDKCLQRLMMCVQEENCPHFIIPANNLMSGKFSAKIKSNILTMMRYVTENSRLVLAKGIQIDELSIRLREKLKLQTDVTKRTAFQISSFLKAQRLIDTAVVTRSVQTGHLQHTCTHYKDIESIEEFQKQSLKMLEQLSDLKDEIQREAYNLLAPFLSSLLGSIQGSRVGLGSSMLESVEAESLLIKGFDADVSSGRLKVASIFYCLGEMERTESILKETETKYDTEIVEPVCSCFAKPRNDEGMNFTKYQDERNQVVRNIVAFCVIFLPIEIKWVPKELQYEMYRLTGDKMIDEEEVTWMDWAVVDSLPYLLFLQYKTYQCLHKQDEQQRALSNMEEVIERTQNLGHKETAFNLLGQCMQENNQPMKALQCYIKSLRLCPRNNAARILICTCLANLFQKKK